MAKRAASAHQQKRHGRHQKKSHHFLKVYSPYLPLVMIVLVILIFSLAKPPASRTDVLGLATAVDSSELLSYTNDQRTASKLGKLSLNNSLSQAAQAKADDMAKRDYWSHISPDGQQPWEFINQAGYTYYKAGENLAYGFSDSASTISGWMNSPSHKANILDRAYKDVGFGITNSKNYQGKGAQTIVVALYATPEASSPDEDPSSLAFVNSDTDFSEPEPRSIAKIQTLTNGETPWIMTAVGVVIGISIASLLIKHAVAVRRAIKRGEKFIMRHLVFDLTVLSFIVLCLIISRTVGIVR